MRVLAVDWSGDARAAHRGIRVAECGPDGLHTVRGGLDREGVVEHLLTLAAPCVVGLDFSFALPAWFAREQGCEDVESLWALVGRGGEGWLQACDPAGTCGPPTRVPSPGVPSPCPPTLAANCAR